VVENRFAIFFINFSLFNIHQRSGFIIH